MNKWVNKALVFSAILLLHMVLLSFFYVNAPAQNKDNKKYTTVWLFSSLPKPSKTVTARTDFAPSVVKPARNIATQKNNATPNSLNAPLNLPLPITEQAKSETTINPLETQTIDKEKLRAMVLADDKKREITPLEKLRQEQHIDKTVEAKIGDAARRSARKDCQTAYQGAGILAVIPLVIDTISDNGCKWKWRFKNLPAL